MASRPPRASLIPFHAGRPLAVSPIYINPFLKEFIAMIITRILSVTFFVTSIAFAANTQSQPMAAPSTPMAGASPHDCARPMAKHDHGAQKNTPTPNAMSGPCAPAAAASASKVKSRHDHAGTKNQ